jgi:hypothetical protein
MAVSERWDFTAIRAGGILALLFAVPLWFAASWAATSRDSPGLALVFSLGALVAFMFGAACAAWIQRLRLPLAHGLVTAIGTYLAVQAVVSVYRIVRGDTINLLNVFFFVTLAALAGLLGGLLGQRLRSVGFVPSTERRIDVTDDRLTNGKGDRS